MKMPQSNKFLPHEINLIRRYLLWCFKTTREDLDRIDRYFTQALVDRRFLDILLKNKENSSEYQKKIADFQSYMDIKEKNALGKKYLNLKKKTLQPEYWYLQARLAAIEQVIVEFLGKRELKSIQGLYENEMTRRILEAREHA
ncbi:MAG: hypothetical protein H6754_00285 [Candidatus Omnitrophica bacterium]|nr:hypothetical protein [Candidatus Omnitrophota bacterium]